MRRALTILITILALAAMAAAPVSAAPPLDVTITAIEQLPTSVGGTFTATGPAVASGLICGTGTTVNDVGAVHGTNPVRFRVDKTFHCTGSTDTFTLRLHVTLDIPTGFTSANWKVASGTGAYAGLKGTGTLVGTPIGVGMSITDVYTGRLH